MILEARSLSERLSKVTLVANLVRKIASSMAASPPPTTISSLPLKKNPSQVAQEEIPLERNLVSDGRLSQRDDAPVAMIMVSPEYSWSPAQTLNGRAEKSTFVTSSKITSEPNRLAWSTMACINSGPWMPWGKPG